MHREPLTGELVVEVEPPWGPRRRRLGNSHLLRADPGRSPRKCHLGLLPTHLPYLYLPGGLSPTPEVPCLLHGVSLHVLQDSCFPAGVSLLGPSLCPLPGRLLVHRGCFLVTQKAQVLCGFYSPTKLE